MLCVKRTMSTFLVFVMLMTILTNVSYAGPQEDLDSKGLVDWTSNSQVILRSGEIYYISLRGASGGNSGNALDCKWEESLSSWYHYTPSNAKTGNVGAITYYKVEPSVDILLSFAKGSKGSNGANMPSFAAATYRFHSFPSPLTVGARSGGNAGTNGLSIGSQPARGGNSSPYPGQRVEYAGAAGGGGGGGGASAIYFSSNTSYIISANGGSGGSAQNGRSRAYYADSGYSDTYRAYGGSGGAGGSIPQNYNNIPNVKITQLSAAEGQARIISPNINGGAVIRRELVVGSEGISVKEIPAGSHIVLTNSYNMGVTRFIKSSASNGLEFTYSAGEMYWYRTDNSTVRQNLDWTNFGKYSVGGSGTTTSMMIRVKEDLRFVAGDGSATFPYYPEEAGSINATISGGGGLDANNVETLSSSIISVASQIEAMLNYEIERFEKEESKITDFKPLSVKVVSIDKASATLKNNIDLLIKVDGRALNQLMCKALVGGVESEWFSIPESGNITVPISKGYNSIIITVKDGNGYTASDVFNIWKLD